MIEAKNINFHYRHNKNDFMINDVSIEIKPGYMTCLLGSNGAGKTTLMSLIYGILNPESGNIYYEGKPVDKKTQQAFHRDVAYFGEKWCANNLKVNENVEMLSLLYPSFEKKLFDKYMVLAQANDISDKKFEILSTGEKAKVETAFLLARTPKFIILDEPLANIDPVFKTDILQILQRSVADNGTGVLISTHLLDEISEMVDYIYVMKNGQIVKQGDRFELLGDEDGSLKSILL
jgi:ABC-2 type transport system ATP-binding protein